MTTSTTTPSVPTPTNRLLAALPPDEARDFLPQLTRVHLHQHQQLYAVGEPITHVAFPLTSLVALLLVLDDGRQVEMAAVGREGFVGLPLAQDSAADGHQARTQIAGEALVLDATAFQTAHERLPGLREVLNRYALVLC